MRRGLVSRFLVLLLAAAGGSSVSSAGELSLLVGTYSGGFGADLDTTARWTSLAYDHGERVRVTIEVPYIEIDGPLEAWVLSTPLGPVRDPRRRHGADGTGFGGDTNPQSVGTAPAASAALAAPGTEALSPASSDTVSGVGDVRLGLSGRLGGGGVRLYRLDAAIRLKAPTADEERGLGTGEWDVRVGLAGEYRFWSVTGFAGAGWNRLGDPEGAELNDVVDVFAGIESEPLAGRIVLSSWIEASDEIVDGAGARAALGAGLRTTGRVRVELQALAGFGQAGEDHAVTLGVSFGSSWRAAGPRRASR